MKKTIFSIAIFVLAISCAKNPATYDGGVSDAVRISATTSMTKVSLAQNGDRIDAAWENGDRIGVFCSAFGAGNYSYTASVPDASAPTYADFQTSDNTKIFTYVPDSEFYAYYPYDKEISATPDALPFELASLQMQDLSSPVAAIKANSIFVSRPCKVSDGRNAQVLLDFKPIFPAVRFNMKMKTGDGFVPLSKVILKSSGAPVVGTGNLDITKPECSVSVKTSGNELTMGVANLWVTEYSYSPLYASVLPGRFTDLKLEVTAIDNSTCTVQLLPATFEAGRIYSVDVELGISDFVEAEPFNVTAASLVCTAGSSINFTLSGEAATVDFWSGEEDHDYAHKGEERFEYEPLMTSFYRSISAGNQANNTKVKVSTDFNGKATETDILAATWIDISEHFSMLLDNSDILGDANPVTTNKATYDQYMHFSGEYDIAPYAGSADAIYFAWFYHVEPYDVELNNSRTRVQVTRLTIGDKYFMDKTNLATVEGASYADETTHCAWQTPKNDVPNYASWRFSSNIRPTTERNAYAFTKSPIAVDKRSLGVVSALPVKTAVENTPKSYSYKFDKPGVYNVVFVATKSNLYGETVEKKFEFTVTVN